MTLGLTLELYSHVWVGRRVSASNMPKAKPKRAPHDVATSATSSSLGMYALGAAAVALVVAAVSLHQPVPAEAAAAESAMRQPAELTQAPLTLLNSSSLQSFSAAHNASLLWGTYRPGVYFGLRSMTVPSAVAAGLMWAPEGAISQLRHQCEQDTLERYGFEAHDGRTFGTQPILDTANGVALQTSFVSTADGGWAARIEVRPAPGDKRTARRQSVFFYLAADSELAEDEESERARFDTALPLPSQLPGSVRLAVRRGASSCGPLLWLSPAISLAHPSDMGSSLLTAGPLGQPRPLLRAGGGEQGRGRSCDGGGRACRAMVERTAW